MKLNVDGEMFLSGYKSDIVKLSHFLGLALCANQSVRGLPGVVMDVVSWVQQLALSTSYLEQMECIECSSAIPFMF
eukprot:4411704-Karenia_brevis.AAC.1